MTSTLKIYDALKTTEFSESQARGIVKALEIASEDATVANGKALVAKLDATAAHFDGELVQLEGRLEAKIASGKSEMIRWMFIFWVGQVAAMRFLR